jgi:hypothetical protein
VERPLTRRALLLLIALAGGCASPRARDVTAIALTPPAAPDAREAADPSIRMDPTSGDLLLSWVAGQDHAWRLWFSRSADSGATWSPPAAVTPPGEAVHPHGEASPRLLVDVDGRLALVWTTSVEVPGRQWPASEIRFARSLDGGRSWSAPVTINDDTTGAPGSHSFHGATVNDGTIVIAWLDERPGPRGAGAPEAGDDASIQVGWSGDFGATWRPNRAITGGVCPCCRVAVAVSGETLRFAWRHHLPGSVRDVVVGTLEGRSARVHEDGWKFEGCPHSGPALAFDEPGSFHLAWYTGAPERNGVWYAGWRIDSTTVVSPVLTGAGLPVTHVSVASAGSHAVVACDVDSAGNRAVTLARVDRGGQVTRRVRVPGSEGAVYPQLVARPGLGAVVAWTAGDDTRSVKLARVPLGE